MKILIYAALKNIQQKTMPLSVAEQIKLNRLISTLEQQAQNRNNPFSVNAAKGKIEELQKTNLDNDKLLEDNAKIIFDLHNDIIGKNQEIEALQKTNLDNDKLLNDNVKIVFDLHNDIIEKSQEIKELQNRLATDHGRIQINQTWANDIADKTESLQGFDRLLKETEKTAKEANAARETLIKKRKEKAKKHKKKTIMSPSKTLLLIMEKCLSKKFWITT